MGGSSSRDAVIHREFKTIDVSAGDRVFVVSDLHLGGGSGADDFGTRMVDKSFLKWVYSFDPTHVILNGDTYECWQFSPADFKREHKVAFEAFQEPPFHHVRGNHDWRFLTMQNVPTDIYIDNGSSKILVNHGCFKDPLMFHQFSKNTMKIVGWLEEHVHPDVDLWISSVKPKSRSPELAMSFADEEMGGTKDLVGVVAGHTHYAPVVQKRAKGIYANSGSCTNGRREGILVECDADRFSITPVVGKRTVKRDAMKTKRK